MRRLAADLARLAPRLCTVGYVDEALEHAQEAVGLYRRLDEEEIGSCTRDLASALEALAVCWAAVGRRDEALDAAEVAVALYR